LKRRQIQSSSDEGYFLQFPLELTQKDYIRRLFEVAARGVSSRILQITNDNHLNKLDNDYDLYYLLKQVLGIGQLDDNTKMRYRVTFAEQLGCDQGKLVKTASTILNTRNEIFHLKAKSSTLDDVQITFQAVRLV
jgi:hypothetical protein